MVIAPITGGAAGLKALLQPIVDLHREPASAEEDLWLDDDADQPVTQTPPAGFIAGMAFCIPTLSTLGLLYTLLK